jgi:hypothetical protein
MAINLFFKDASTESPLEAEVKISEADYSGTSVIGNHHTRNARRSRQTLQPCPAGGAIRVK